MSEKKNNVDAKRKNSVNKHHNETESLSSIEVEGTVVKVVFEATEDAATQQNKRIAKRATRIARNNAFQRSLPLSVYRNGKVEELFADTEEN